MTSPLNVIQPKDHCFEWFFHVFLAHSTIAFKSHVPSVVGRCDGFDGSFTSSCHWRCFCAFINLFRPLQIDKCTTVRGWVSRSPPFPRSQPSRCPSTKWWDSLSLFLRFHPQLARCLMRWSRKCSTKWTMASTLASPLTVPREAQSWTGDPMEVDFVLKVSRIFVKAWYAGHF